MSALHLIAKTCEKGSNVTALLSPLLDFGLRFWVAYAFFLSGLTKIQSWSTTVMLFEYEYAVPLLSPVTAAWTGAATELILPIFLLLGFLARPVALALFIFNAIAVYSYGSFLFGEDGGAGLQQHILWGVMLLVIFVHGLGKLSLDALVAKRYGAA
ncbi:MAG: DoxX family protein [Gammaproteobacteria bacterium]|nr:DoxX family protein [Gammaproteobacteria bacterium]